MNHERKVKLNTLALGTTKPSKDQARADVMWIADQLSDGAPENEAIARLLRYFQPAVPATVKSVDHWLAKFIDKHNIDDRKTRIYSNGDRVYATNGHALLSAPVTKKTAAAGFYDQQLNQINFSGQPLEYERVIDRFSATADTISIDKALTGCRVTTTDKCMQIVELAPGVWVQLKYAKQLVAILGDREKATMSYHVQTEAHDISYVRMDRDGCIAVVSGVRYNEDEDR